MYKTITLLLVGIGLFAATHIQPVTDQFPTYPSASFWITTALADEQPQGASDVAQSQEEEATDDKSTKSETDVDVTVTRETNEVVWYADPLWIGVGIGVALLVIALIALAVRGGGGSSTTIVRG